MKARILIVDDEVMVLEGLEAVLRKGYEVITALGGEAGMRALREKGPFRIVVSDMRMPGMDGAAFLARVREESPDSIRLLLTGYADLDASVRAVNQGQIFRFLTKPCPTATLTAALAEAERQYQLVVAERELLEKTLHGSIAALIDLLGLVQPTVFGRATRLQKRAGALADRARVPDRWQIEVAALLSQVGFVALPPGLVERWFRGETVTPEERAMVERVPAIGEKLLAHIPRLEGVLEIIRLHPLRYDEAMRANKALPMGARILKVVIDLDEVEASLGADGGAVDMLVQRKGRYDPNLLEAAEELFGGVSKRRPMEISVSRLEVGMILVDEVRTVNGMLVVGRGQMVTPALLERLRNFSQKFVEPVMVWTT